MILYDKDLKEEAYKEGYDKGYDKGARHKLREQVDRKLSKGKTIEVIADELEESIGVIEEIIEEIKETDE